MFDNYELLWKGIIRPPRATYHSIDIGINVLDEGPKVFRKNGMKIKRTDV